MEVPVWSAGLTEVTATVRPPPEPTPLNPQRISGGTVCFVQLTPSGDVMIAGDRPLASPPTTTNCVPFQVTAFRLTGISQGAAPWLQLMPSGDVISRRFAPMATNRLPPPGVPKAMPLSWRLIGEGR